MENTQLKINLIALLGESNLNLRMALWKEVCANESVGTMEYVISFLDERGFIKRQIPFFQSKLTEKGNAILKIYQSNLQGEIEVDPDFLENIPEVKAVKGCR
jgi:hypothetical protein